MSNPWCRLWSDLPNDPKWRTIAKVSAQPITSVISVYIHMMVCASNATERGRTQGWNNEDIAAALDVNAVEIELIVAAMQGRVIDGDLLTGWEKRQPKREDGGGERAKAWRERNRTQPNAKKRPDTDTDTDKEEPKILPASEDAAGDFILTKKDRKMVGKRLETFIEFWDAFGYKKGKAEAADAWLDIHMLTDTLVAKIVTAAKAEAVSRPTTIAKGQTPKMAQGWLSAKRWNDEQTSGIPVKREVCL